MYPFEEDCNKDPVLSDFYQPKEISKKELASILTTYFNNSSISAEDVEQAIKLLGLTGYVHLEDIKKFNYKLEA